jgi:hypothetical protein
MLGVLDSFTQKHHNYVQRFTTATETEHEARTSTTSSNISTFVTSKTAAATCHHTFSSNSIMRYYNTLLLLTAILLALTTQSTQAMPVSQLAEGVGGWRELPSLSSSSSSSGSMLAEAIETAAAVVAASDTSNANNFLVDHRSFADNDGSDDGTVSRFAVVDDSIVTPAAAALIQSILASRQDSGDYLASHGHASVSNEVAVSPAVPVDDFVKKVRTGGGQKQGGGRRSGSGPGSANNKIQQKIKYSNQNNQQQQQQQSQNLLSGSASSSLHHNPLNNKKIFRANPNLQRLEKKSWKIPIKSIALYSENSKDSQNSQMMGDLKELFDTFKDS